MFLWFNAYSVGYFFVVVVVYSTFFYFYIALKASGATTNCHSRQKVPCDSVYTWFTETRYYACFRDSKHLL